MSFYSNPFVRKIMRWQFSGMGGVIGASSRIEIYEALELLVSNDVMLVKALREIYRVESKDGRKKTEINAIIIYEAVTALESGRPLADALEPWIPDQETQLIRAGERSGNLQGAFKDSIRIIEAKRKIMGAVLAGAAYPMLLMAMVCLLLWQVSSKMVPQFARMLPPEQWTGAAAVLRVIADFVTNYGFAAAGVATVIGAWITWSMPNMHRSRLRLYLDRIPPWSIYRMLHGSTFLLNIAVMLRAGIRVQEILTMMGKNGSPWLRSRIGAALQGINAGRNLGLALHSAGQNFPDERAVQFLRILAEQEGFDDKLANFGERWLEKSVSAIGAASKIMLAAGICMSGGLIMLILAGVMSIQSLAQQLQ